jgi:hypothetical protein
MGANTSWCARFTRTRGFLQGLFRTWNDINLKALAEHKLLLTAQKQHVLKDFIQGVEISYLKASVFVKALWHL